MKYVLIINGVFVKSFTYKLNALEGFSIVIKNLTEEQKKYNSITLEEMTEIVFHEYKVLGYDDSYLQGNGNEERKSKIIEEY